MNQLNLVDAHRIRKERTLSSKHKDQRSSLVCAAHADTQCVRRASTSVVSVASIFAHTARYNARDASLSSVLAANATVKEPTASEHLIN